MSEEVLWYAARVSGLMAWILSFGALAAGLLARSEPAHGTTAGQWAIETRNLLGRISLVALLLHAAAIASADRFGLTAQGVITGRQSGTWLAAAVVIGVICGWAMLVVEVGRLGTRHVSAAADLAMLAVSAAVVTGGAIHGWEVGSDTQNPLAVVVVVLCGLLLLAAAAIGLTTVMRRERISITDAKTGAPVIGSVPAAEWGERTVLGQSVDTSTEPDRASSRPETPFDTKLSLSLSRRIESPIEDVFDRGPTISSARDVPASSPEKTSGVTGVEAAGSDSEGAWSMRKLPDAPKPAHRKRDKK